MNGAATAITAWLDDRLGIAKLRELAAHKTVPLHRYTVFYYLGGMTLFFFLIQVMTGVLLMLYYRPGADEAFESVEFIMTSVPFGWLMRSIHSWSANLMVFFATIHLVSVFFMKAYRAPREATWITGVILFFLTLGFGFSGYLLPWNQLAFFATKVGTDVGGAVPVVGEWSVRFLRGGDRVTGATLARFYGWHVAVLPALTVVALAVHLVLVQTKGMSIPPGSEDDARRRPPMKFFPHFALRDLTGWVFALGVLAALAALFPWELGEKADMFAPAYENIRPEWQFVFMFQTLKLVPGGEILGIEYEAIPLLIFSAAGLVLLLVPFLDRKQSRLWTVAGVIGLIYAVAMTCWGYASLVPLYVVIVTVVLLALLALITRGPRKPTLMAILIAVVAISGTASAAPQTSCTVCHAGEPQARAFATDVHGSVGLGCHDCHGGNPDPTLADDFEAAMKGVTVPKRAEMPAFCGRCHSSADFMRRFNPAARVDQVAEYWSSRHGKRLRQGEERVATCVDCHSVHDIRRRTDTASPVHPTRVAETCRTCHSNAGLMSAFNLPIDQYSRWRVSVHAQAMFEKGDLTAPTCNDCHGNHGATPPGVESISFVCGQCHLREAELFRASTKHTSWTRHNDMTGGAECSGCHDGKRAAVKVARFSECITCHENHGVVRPTVAMLGVVPETPCAFCHDGTGPLAQRVAEPPKKAQRYLAFRDALLREAEARGLKGDQRFDFLVDRALQLPTHLQGGRKDEPARLRPEFSRLFDKFRIGKTHYTYLDAATGRPVLVPVRRCDDCHDAQEGAGNLQAHAYVDSTRALTSMIARSDRILLAAQRGGVEVRRVRSALDDAVDAQIELETLVHTFDPKPVAAKQTEGLAHAQAALVAGQNAMDELSYRRRGLFVALGFILLTLVALALKIHML